MKLKSQTVKGEISKRNSSRITPFFIFALFVSLIISAVIAFNFSDWYFEKQASFFSHADSIMFIHDDMSLWFMVFSPMILIFLTLHKLFKRDVETIFGCGICTIGIVATIIITLFVMAIQFFNYSIINTDGIVVKGGLGEKVFSYSWKDIEKVDVTYHYSKSKSSRIGVDYIIKFNDGAQINAVNSSEFFESIEMVDKTIRQNKVAVSRSWLSNKVYRQLKYEYTGKVTDSTKDRFEIILYLFDKSY